MKTATTKMNYDQLCLLPEDGNRYELFDGELVMTPSPVARHQEIVGKLHVLLAIHVQNNSLGKVYVAPLDAIFDQYNVLQPDLLYVSRERVPEVVKERIQGAPDFVVEVLSPSTFYNDLRRKMVICSQFGVQEYWIVDPEMQTIELYSRQGGELRSAQKFSASETFESPLLPGFRFSVNTLFED